jgi:hypothetical protein
MLTGRNFRYDFSKFARKLELNLTLTLTWARSAGLHGPRALFWPQTKTGEEETTVSRRSAPRAPLCSSRWDMLIGVEDGPLYLTLAMPAARTAAGGHDTAALGRWRAPIVPTKLGTSLTRPRWSYLSRKGGMRGTLATLTMMSSTPATSRSWRRRRK